MLKVLLVMFAIVDPNASPTVRVAEMTLTECTAIVAKHIAENVELMRPASDGTMIWVGCIPK